MNKLIIFATLLVLLVLFCSTTSAKKQQSSKKRSTTKSQSKKFKLNPDACACDGTFSPVCDLQTYTQYPSSCLAKCMGVPNTVKGACPVKVKTVTKNVCNEKSSTKQSQEMAKLLQSLIQRTKQVEEKLNAFEKRAAKIDRLSIAEDEIKEIVSKKLPATNAPVATAAPALPATQAPVATPAAVPAKKTRKAVGNKSSTAGKKKPAGSSKKGSKKNGNKKGKKGSKKQ